MIRIKDPKQLQMFDPWGFLSPKRRRILDETWPGLFREHLLCELPVNKVTPFFREGFGRPTKDSTFGFHFEPFNYNRLQAWRFPFIHLSWQLLII